MGFARAFGASGPRECYRRHDRYPHARQARIPTRSRYFRSPPARSSAAPGRPRSRRAADPHRPADQQGHRAQSAGALAIHRRRAGGSAARVPVHQRDRLQGQALRHAGGGRRAGVVAGNLRHGDGPAGRSDRRRLDACDRQSDSAGRGDRRAVPGGRDRRRRAARAGWRPAQLCRCRSRRRASMPRPISPQRSA